MGITRKRQIFLVKVEWAGNAGHSTGLRVDAYKPSVSIVLYQAINHVLSSVVGHCHSGVNTIRLEFHIGQQFKCLGIVNLPMRHFGLYVVLRIVGITVDFTLVIHNTTGKLGGNDRASECRSVFLLGRQCKYSVGSIGVLIELRLCECSIKLHAGHRHAGVIISLQRQIAVYIVECNIFIAGRHSKYWFFNSAAGRYAVHAHILDVERIAHIQRVETYIVIAFLTHLKLV